VATSRLLPVVALIALIAGCGDGDTAESMQDGLAPATADVGAVPVATSPSLPDSAAGVSGAGTGPGVVAPIAHTAPESAPLTAIEEAAARSQPLSIDGRESFAYTGGSRDPFLSLLANRRVGPELPDLLLVAVYYDTRNPGNSVAVLREKIGGKRYNLRQGDRIGRARVSAIRPKDVFFVVDDFGTEREETMTLRKQEETP